MCTSMSPESRTMAIEVVGRNSWVSRLCRDTPTTTWVPLTSRAKSSTAAAIVADDDVEGAAQVLASVRCVAAYELAHRTDGGPD